MRVVIDTNVFVSAVLGGLVAPVLDHWRAGRFTLVVTDEIVREYLEVLNRPKFGLPADVLDSIGLYLLQKAEFTAPVEQLSVIEADPKDDKFVEAAVAGEVALIVSGDSHLLDLETYQDISVVTVSEFLGRLEKENPPSEERPE